MADLLPPASRVTVRAGAARLDAASLARVDAAIVVIDAADAPAALARLPMASLWQRQYRAARKDGDPPVLAARLANGRHTLLAVGITRHGDSAFRRLELAGKLAARVLERGISTVHCHVQAKHADGWRDALASALLAAAAPMPERRSKPTPPCDLRKVVVHGAGRREAAAWAAVAEGNHLARWLATLPPNELDCVGYRRLLQQLARREGWSFRFYDERALARAGAGAFLAVSRANAHRGAGIVRLRWRGRGRAATPSIALVGKGICFDTGGINLKPHRGMYTMHGDMQGSAVAVGTLLACSRTGAPLDIDCWLALTENEIGPRAYRPQEVVRASNGVTIQVVHSDAEGRMVLADTLALASRERPGDVVRSMAGKTIEVINTDAEGRLILCDALYYTRERFKPKAMIDLATLTGAVIVALGHERAGLFSNDEALAAALGSAGDATGELLWRLPLGKDYEKHIRSDIADIKNVGRGREAGSTAGAVFLQQFVGDTPWAHLDIAGTAWSSRDLPLAGKGATGFGVRLLDRLVADRYEAPA